MITRTEILKLCPSLFLPNESYSKLDILTHDVIPFDDKMWILLRPNYFEPEILHYLSLAFIDLLKVKFNLPYVDVIFTKTAWIKAGEIKPTEIEHQIKDLAMKIWAARKLAQGTQEYDAWNALAWAIWPSRESAAYDTAVAVGRALEVAKGPIISIIQDNLNKSTKHAIR